MREIKNRDRAFKNEKNGLRRKARARTKKDVTKKVEEEADRETEGGGGGQVLRKKGCKRARDGKLKRVNTSEE